MKVCEIWGNLYSWKLTFRGQDFKNLWRSKETTVSLLFNLFLFQCVKIIIFIWLQRPKGCNSQIGCYKIQQTCHPSHFILENPGMCTLFRVFENIWKNWIYHFFYTINFCLVTDLQVVRLCKDLFVDSPTTTASSLSDVIILTL